MTEFLVALAVLLPLFLAVVYAGRYSDMHFTAVQASRYAAMQRVMQPDPTRLPDARLEDQIRARFFSHGIRNQGRLRSDDTAARLDGRATTPLWRDLAGNPLMQNLRATRLTTGTADLRPPAALRPSVNFMASRAGQTYRDATVGHVEVGSLLNRMDMSVASPQALSIGATTAAAAGGLGSSGSTMTTASARRMVPSASVPPQVNSVIGAAMRMFEPAAPVFGCVKPDVVPSGRLDRAVPAGGCQ